MSAKLQFPPNTITAANTTRINAEVTNLLFACAGEEQFIERVRFQPLGTNVATVGRIFANDGQDVGNARNNALVGEVTLPSTTASEVAALAAVEFTAGFYLPAKYRLYCTIGTAVSAGFSVTAYAGLDPDAPQVLQLIIPPVTGLSRLSAQSLAALAPNS